MMSEFSMKLHSKKGAARIQKAQKFLSDVKSEENKIIKQIQEIAKPVSKRVSCITNKWFYIMSALTASLFNFIMLS